MTAQQQDTYEARLEQALDELREMILGRFPDTTFSVSISPDDPDIVHLNAVVDLEDTEEVIDLVIDRMLELQIDEGLPIHVIPLRPLERVLAMRRSADRDPQALPMIQTYP